MINGGGRPCFEREPVSASVAKSSSSEAKRDVETTALVIYNPRPHLDHVFDETIFLNGKELTLAVGPCIVGDIVPTILSYCDATTLSRASCVCVEWRRISQCNDLWENLCRERFGVSANEIRPKPDPTKLLYILAHRRLREVCRMNVNPFTGRVTTTHSGMRSLPTIPFTLTGGL
mmetsp:Transcript_8779/g.26273  ORF Transcript_8779/g.26273 Transcript_8779/m.26273 type:complete len:175 (-) Transcript_8779:200-724(-)